MSVKLFLDGANKCFFLLQKAKSNSGAHPAPYPMSKEKSIFLGVNKRFIKLTTHFHLTPKVRMRGIICPLPHTPSRNPQGKRYLKAIFKDSEDGTLYVFLLGLRSLSVV